MPQKGARQVAALSEQGVEAVPVVFQVPLGSQTEKLISVGL